MYRMTYCIKRKNQSFMYKKVILCTNFEFELIEAGYARYCCMFFNLKKKDILQSLQMFCHVFLRNILRNLSELREQIYIALNRFSIFLCLFHIEICFKTETGKKVISVINYQQLNRSQNRCLTCFLFVNYNFQKRFIRLHNELFKFSHSTNTLLLSQ